MFKMFNALDELFARTQENDELEWMDLLGNRSKCIFKWKPAIEPGKLIELREKNHLNLPESYCEFLLKSNGAVLYDDDDEDSGYKLLSLEEAIAFTKEMKEVGYNLKEEWFIFMTTFFSSDMFIFDMKKLETDTYIIDGIGDYSEREWKYIRGDFRIFMNRLFIANGCQYWKY